MENFSKYYLSRVLADLSDPDMISESVSQDFDYRSFVRDGKKKSSVAREVRRAAARYPSAQHCDIEDSVMEALKEVSRRKPSTEASAKRIFKKHLASLISGAGRRAKGARKNLSCIKSIKVSGAEMQSLLGRAGKILTPNEKKILEMCVEGKSVRDIGSKMGMSFPTAWRILNSAVDKIRISHGMKSRHKDRR
jgi:DNA-binding CsgD family transcriptional regulator